MWRCQRLDLGPSSYIGEILHPCLLRAHSQTLAKECGEAVGVELEEFGWQQCCGREWGQRQKHLEPSEIPKETEGVSSIATLQALESFPLRSGTSPLTIRISPGAVLWRQDEGAGCGDRDHCPLSKIRDSCSCRQAKRGMVGGARLLGDLPCILEAQARCVAEGLLLRMAFGGN